MVNVSGTKEALFIPGYVGTKNIALSPQRNQFLAQNPPNMPPLSAFLVNSGLLGTFALLKLLTTATIGGNVLQAGVLYGIENAKF